MKALLTGATGFIGSNLARHLLEAGYIVKALVRKSANRSLIEELNLEYAEGDLLKTDSLREAVENCDVVFHVAASYNFYPFWRRKPREIYDINARGTLNLIEACFQQNIKKFIYTSTVATIGKRSDNGPSDEATPLIIGRGISHYARSKLTAEKEVLNACSKGLPAVVLNPAIVLGRQDIRPGPSGEVIVKFLNRSYPGYFNTIWPVADVDDVARAHIKALDSGRTGEKYILCNKEHYTLKEIFELLEEVSGVKSPRLKIPYAALLGFTYLDETLSEIFHKKPLMPAEGVRFCKKSVRFSNAKAIKELGFTQTPIRKTLLKAVSWYRENGYIK